VKRLVFVSFLFLLLLTVTTRSVAADSEAILTCTVTGESKIGTRVVNLKVVPPKAGEWFHLWALTDEHEPGHLLKNTVGVGTVEVDYGGYIERRDLVFLQIGTEGGSSHVAFWLRKGVFEHANFLIIDIWDPSIPIHLVESVEPEPFLSGNCR